MEDLSGNIPNRWRPLPDVFCQRRAASACHLRSGSLISGRKPRLDPHRRQFEGDSKAAAILQREPIQLYFSEV